MLKWSSLSYSRLKCKTIALCLLWYSVSSAGSIVNKVFLQQFPFPLTLALSNLICVPLFAYPCLKYWQVEKSQLSKREYNNMLVPLSVGKAIAVICAYFSLWKVPVSYAHTVKASMPLFAVILSRLILKEQQGFKVYVSLLPIILGVFITSATEISFSFSGMISALFSTFTYSLLSIVTKKLLRSSGINPLRLLAMNSQLAAIFCCPLWFLRDGLYLLTKYETDASKSYLSMYILLLSSGLFSFLQNVCAFQLIHELTALSYSVCNSTKRIIVIVASLLMLQNPVTGLNIFGVFLSVMGVFCYSRAKQRDYSGTRLPHNQDSAALIGSVSK